MNDYYSIYTWAMDKQDTIEREAKQRRLIRESKPVSVRLRWPGLRREAVAADVHQEEHDAVA